MSDENKREEYCNQNKENFGENQNSSPKKKENSFSVENKQEEENFEKEKKDFSHKTSKEFFNRLKNINSPKREKYTFKDVSMGKTTGNFFPLKSNIDLLNRRLNFTSSNFKRTENTGNNLQKFDKNYLSNYNTITKKDFFKNKNCYEQNYKKKNDGFHSYNVPRVQLKIDSSKPMNKLAERIGMSCVGNKRVSYESAYSKAKLNEVMEENEKLKQIMNQQTNNNFLNSNNLPDIKYVVSQPKIKIKKVLFAEEIKYMGNKNIPFNFQAKRDCERIRRNNVGGFYKH